MRVFAAKSKYDSLCVPVGYDREAPLVRGTPPCYLVHMPRTDRDERAYCCAAAPAAPNAPLASADVNAGFVRAALNSGLASADRSAELCSAD